MQEEERQKGEGWNVQTLGIIHSGFRICSGSSRRWHSIVERTPTVCILQRQVDFSTFYVNSARERIDVRHAE